MDTWKQAYLDVRKKIEQSGRDARWEFDRKKLFERSEYISQVCSDIHDVAQVTTCSFCREIDYINYYRHIVEPMTHYLLMKYSNG